MGAATSRGRAQFQDFANCQQLLHSGTPGDVYPDLEEDEFKHEASPSESKTSAAGMPVGKKQ